MLVVSLNYNNTVEDIKKLISSGVEEFYFGYMPKEWYQRYGWEISTNRRESSVIPHIISPEKALEVITLIHSQNKKVYLALNAHYYINKQYSLLRRIVNFFEENDIDGYIIADIAFILALKKWSIKKEIHLSVGGGCYNRESIEFYYREFGIKRFILPRKLSILEVKNLLDTTSKRIRLELFLLGEMCKYNDPYCFTFHGYNREFFCREKHIEILCLKKEKRFLLESGRTVKNLTNDKKFTFPNLFPWCGLCCIAFFREYRDRILFKIPNRLDAIWRLGSRSYRVDIEVICEISKLLKKVKISLSECQRLGKKLGFCKPKDNCIYNVLEYK